MPPIRTIKYRCRRIKVATKNESLLEFPCQFPIKALGRANESFDSYVVQIVRKHVPDIFEGAVQSRLSRAGKYVSVTVTIQASSQAQLDAIYQDLSDCPDVLMAL